ncbi:MAG TPA: nuclear transport factor 2 family protein [Burkholderiaceae bacterium]|jgi:hypothetical protein
MSTPQEITDRYLAAWNETDAERRLALLRRQWSADARYVDPMASAAGVDEVHQLIGAVQARFPGFAFAQRGRADGHGAHVRFSWSLGPADIDAPIEGSDVVTVRDGRIDGVIGFLDKIPQAA